MNKKLKFRIVSAILIFAVVFSPAGIGGGTVVLAACASGQTGGSGGGGGGGGYGSRPGGVSLDKAATFLADMSNVTGAYYDQTTNRIVFMGTKLPANQTPIFNKDDLAVAIKSIVFNNSVPTVDIGNPSDPMNTTQPVTYSPGIAETNFGNVLARADYSLKSYVLGKNSDGTTVTSSVSGYQSFADRYLSNNPPEDLAPYRMWLEPQYINVKADLSSNSFVFDQVKMQVLFQSYPGSTPSTQLVTAGNSFAEHLTNNYDAYASENVWLAKTKELSKITGVVKWIKDSGIASDFKWAKNYKPQYVDTWETVQFYPSAFYNVGGNSRAVFGGVAFTTPNTYNSDNGASATLKSLSQIAAPSQLSDHWTFNQSGQIYQSVAVSANAFRAAGSYEAQAVDLNVDTAGSNNLIFERKYNSLGFSSGEIGKGWDYVPAHLTSISKDVGVLCSPQGGYQGIYQSKLAFQTLDGIYETFTYNCNLAQYVPDQFEYNATIIKNNDGTFSAVTKDQRIFTFEGGVFKDEYAVQSVKDWNNNKITFTYSSGLISSIKDDQNRAITLIRNGNGIITSISDWAGRTVLYSYDSSGNLTGVTDPRNNVSTYTYDANGRLNGAKDRQNRITLSNTYDTENRLTSQTSSAGLTMNFTYDEANKIVTGTDANGRLAKTYYDSKMRVIKRVDPLNNYTEYTYGVHPVPLTERDKNGNTITRTLNDWADELSVTYPDGKQVTKQYNIFHYPLNISDNRYGGSPKVTVLSYDTKGNLLSKNDAGITTQYTYDIKGNALTQKDGLNQQTAYTYDTFSHVLTVTDPTSAVTTNTYDSLGRLTQAVDASSITTGYTYDKNNNVTTEINAVGTTTNTYSPDNQLTKAITPDSRTTEFTYSAPGTQTTTKDALTNTTTYGYDSYKNLVSKQDALNRTTQYQYDLLNRQKQSTTPLGKVAKWEYDANGNLTKRIDESNRNTIYEYDSLNRLKKITYPDGSIFTNVYDDRGNLTQATSAAGTSSYVYDIHDRMTSETDPNNATTTYAYDNAGNITSVTYPDSKVVGYTYNTRNQLVTTTDWNSQQTTYQYNANGSLASKQSPNGLIATYGYDQAARLTSLQYTKNSALVTRFNYERDVSGDIVKETETKNAPAQLPTANLSIFDDVVNAGWNTSSSYNVVYNLAETLAQQGAKALSYVSNAWGYATFKINSGSLNTATYSAISFAAKASQAGQKVYLVLRDSTNTRLKKIDISHFGGNLTTTGYKVYTIPLSALNASNKQIKSFEFSNEQSTNSQPKIYLDNIKLTTDPASPVVMYGDELTGDFTSYPWSGATADYNDTTSPYTGSKAIGLTLSTYGGLTLYDYRGISTTGYQSISFAVKGSAASQKLAVQISNGSGSGGQGPELNLADYGGNPVNGTWKLYTIPISSFAPPNGIINGFVFINKSNLAQPKILIDEIKLNLPDSNGSQNISTYAYDALGRIILANQPNGKSYSYTYNAVGNRLTSNENGTASTHTYNNDNQLTAKGSRTFTYDNQGNQITDATKALTFDFDNRLKIWSSPSPSLTVNYSYDSQGKRISKVSGGTTRQYVSSTANGLSKVLVEKNITNSTSSYYVYGDTLLSQGGATSGSRQYFITDGTGNVRYVTDSAATSVQAYTYDPYGNETTTGTATNYSLQTEEKDRENNLTYLRARYYDPSTGRFLAKDPVAGVLAVPESQNGYSYAHNDPVNLSDPSGEIIDTIWDVGNIVYDVSQCQWGDAAFDTAAAFVPFVPAGTSKLRYLNNSNPQQFKVLSNGEIQKLQKAGIDPHDKAIKPGGSKQDIFKDGKGNLFVMPKNGSGPGDPLGININNL